MLGAPRHLGWALHHIPLPHTHPNTNYTYVHTHDENFSKRDQEGLLRIYETGTLPKNPAEYVYLNWTVEAGGNWDVMGQPLN